IYAVNAEQGERWVLKSASVPTARLVPHQALASRHAQTPHAPDPGRVDCFGTNPGHLTGRQEPSHSAGRQRAPAVLAEPLRASADPADPPRDAVLRPARAPRLPAHHRLDPRHARRDLDPALG